MDGNISKKSAGLESTRRGFLKSFTGVLVAFCLMLVGIPVVGSFIGSAFRKIKPGWINLGEIQSLPLGQPAHLTATDVQIDAYVRETAVRHIWAVRRSAAE